MVDTDNDLLTIAASNKMIDYWGNLLAFLGLSSLVAVTQVWQYDMPRTVLLKLSYYGFVFAFLINFAVPLFAMFFTGVFYAMADVLRNPTIQRN